MTPKGKHAPASPATFYASLARHALGAVAVLAIVVLVVTLATRGDDGPPLGISSTPTGSTSATADPSASADPSVPAKPSESPATRQPMAREDIKVTVLNGTSTAGIAGNTGDRITARGYVVENVDNAERPRNRTVIFYRGDSEPEARLLLEDFPDLLRIKEASPNAEFDPDSTLTVILGSDHRDA